MSTRQGYYNRDIGKWVDAGGTSQYNEASEPYVRRRENLTFQLNTMQTNATTGVTEQYTGWATGGPYTFRFFIDNDYVNYMIGTLETAITAGAITEVKVDALDITAGSPLSTGRIVLTNTAGESETIAYTAYSLAAGVYTFTVSATATYSYALDDEAKVVEPSLIEAENTDIDQTNVATGILVVTMDANNQAFTNAADAAASAEISGCLFELQVLDGSANIVDTIGGEFRCLNLLVDDFAAPPPGPTSNFYTKAEALALFLIKAGSSGGQQAYGGTGSGEDLTLNSTSNATKGSVILGAAATGVEFVETTGYLKNKGLNVLGATCEIYQLTHGFAAQDAVCKSGTTWIKAQADDADTLATFVVVSVTDADNFVIRTGALATFTAHGFSESSPYLYVSAATAGLMTATPPTGITEYSNPIAYVIDANTLFIFPWRPYQALERSNDGMVTATVTAASYDTLTTDQVVPCDTTSNAIVVNLLDPTLYPGYTVTIKKVVDTSPTNVISVRSAVGNVDEVIGTTGVDISVYLDAQTFRSDGANYIRI